MRFFSISWLGWHFINGEILHGGWHIVQCWLSLSSYYGWRENLSYVAAWMLIGMLVVTVNMTHMRLLVGSTAMMCHRFIGWMPRILSFLKIVLGISIFRLWFTSSMYWDRCMPVIYSDEGKVWSCMSHSWVKMQLKPSTEIHPQSHPSAL